MYFSQDFLGKVVILLVVWVVYLSFVAYVIKALNKRGRSEKQRIMQVQQDAEEVRLKMRMDAEAYERVGRYEEAAVLYEESGELEKARQCKMLADYLIEVNH